MSFKKNSPGWLLNDSDHVLDKILCLSLRLWLFVNPDLEDETMTLQQSVQKFLSKIRGSSNKWLWLDFCEQTLIKRGKFRIVYTSDIAQHLTFASKSDIRVFSHASVLELYESIAEGLGIRASLLNGRMLTSTAEQYTLQGSCKSSGRHSTSYGPSRIHGSLNALHISNQSMMSTSKPA